MTITASQLKEIRQEFAKLKPATVTLDGHRPMTIKEAIFSLAPTLERMKKRGFDTQEIVEKLHEKGIEIKAQTLTKYLTEARRQREDRKTQKRDTPPPACETQTAQQLIAADTPSDAANNEL
uniref:protein MobC n=1 Tax=uncultured Bilophila sp. TaxID=529385 RepID=UPI0025F6F796|nr:protein MobC [uncultured Bilophila sp.]